MEKEPLLLPRSNSWLQKPPPPPIFIPRNLNTNIEENNNLVDDASFPVPLTPSQFKERLIFGPSPPRNTAHFLDSFHDQPSPSSPLRSKKKCLHRAKTAPAMAILNDAVIAPPVAQTPHPETPHSLVRQTVALLSIYLLLGTTFYWFNRDDFKAHETHPAVDALYFCIVTMCTIGYGDITPDTVPTKMFYMLFVLVGFGFVDILLSGMVCHVLDLQENHLLRMVLQQKAGAAGKRDGGGKSYIVDVKKGRMRIRLKVALAFGVVVMCITIGGVVLHFLESLGWVDSFYVSVMSVTTVGYGDRAFTTLDGRIFAVVWLLVSTLAVARAFLFLAEARVDKRHRRMAKWVLGHNMTVSEFLAADMDNNGNVSKPEFVIYKLKEMGKILDKDVIQICEQFDRLDSGNCGKITLADLVDTNI